MIIVFTPRVGLGCRSLGYIIYALISVLVMSFTIISKILARFSETRRKPTFVKGFTAFVAGLLNYTCISLAFINSTGLIVISCSQFSHFLDNCYCNASVIGHGVDSYVIIAYEGSTNTMRDSRIAAVALSTVSMLVYMVFLRLVSALPNRVDDVWNTFFFTTRPCSFQY